MIYVVCEDDYDCRDILAVLSGPPGKHDELREAVRKYVSLRSASVREYNEKIEERVEAETGEMRCSEYGSPENQLFYKYFRQFKKETPWTFKKFPQWVCEEYEGYTSKEFEEVHYCS